MPKRVDCNQAEIVLALRQAGARVHPLHAVGAGVPDLLVGVRGVNYLIEVKTLRGRLTRVQIEWHIAWRGQVAVCRTVEDALRACRLEAIG